MTARGWWFAVCAGKEGRWVSGGTPARIPNRLGEPGSLFSRYKFLQLRLVVVMLLTRTRRELLKRRAIGGGAYILGGFLEPRVTRHPLRHRRQPPLHPRPVGVVMRFFSSASFINLPLSSLSLSLSLSAIPSPLELHLKDKHSRCLRVICIPPRILEVLPLRISIGVLPLLWQFFLACVEKEK